MPSSRDNTQEFHRPTLSDRIMDQALRYCFALSLTTGKLSSAKRISNYAIGCAQSDRIRMHYVQVGLCTATARPEVLRTNRDIFAQLHPRVSFLPLPVPPSPYSGRHSVFGLGFS
jgi:hypothetical protein